MIQVQIDGDAYDVDADLRWRVEGKIGGLDRYLDTLDGGHVTLSWARAWKGDLFA